MEIVETRASHHADPRARLEAFVGGAAWCTGLCAKTRQRLLQATRLRRLDPGEVLCRQGEAPTHWYGIVEGLLRLDMLCRDGRLVALTAGPVGSWFGEASIVIGEPRIYEVSAMRPSAVACMDARVFRQALKDDCDFASAVLRLLGYRTRAFIELFARERGHSATRRVAAILASLVGQTRHGPLTRIDISQEELAQLAGLTRQRANQALRALQARGLVEVSYASVSVRDLARLAAA